VSYECKAHDSFFKHFNLKIRRINMPAVKIEKLGELASATKLFQIEERTVGDGPSKAIFLKDIRKK
jgi:hypothetical protein